MTPAELRCLRDHQATLLMSCGCQGMATRHHPSHPWLMLPGLLQRCAGHSLATRQQAQQTLA